ncbi:MAG: hypothetical protein LH613_05260 [Chamaesiphon sp.]|nr:hypothetical protein [Chamaesiphon sp.]
MNIPFLPQPARTYYSILILLDLPWQHFAIAKKISNGFYSFGVVDLVKDLNDCWYALEVGTDGIYNHVDRDLENDDLLDELNQRLAIAFWKRLGTPPWGKSWKYQELI